jgi:hypothetical protein
VGGLAAAIVPCAMIVHLVAEAAANASDGLSLGFVVRHAYFVVLFALAAFWFGSTVGLGRSASERRRRCALVRADLDTRRHPQHLFVLAAANVAFFMLTQAVEGMPILGGAFALGLGVALAGSLLSAVLIFLFGGSLVGAVLDSVIGTAPLRDAAVSAAPKVDRVATPRHATFTYSLFMPNRPPPITSRI